MNTFRQMAPVLLATILASGLAACGSSGSTGANGATASPSATADPLVGLTALQIINKATADTSAASSMHFAMTGTDSGQDVSASITVVKGKGCEGTVAEGTSGSFELISLGKADWIKPDAAFWKTIAQSTPGDSAAMSVLSGKYLEESGGGTSGLGAMASLCNLSNLFKTPSTDKLARGGISTFDGQRVITVTDVTEKGTAYVTDNSTPLILQATTRDSSDTHVTFSGYDQSVTITAPPAAEVIDGSEYGF